MLQFWMSVIKILGLDSTWLDIQTILISFGTKIKNCAIDLKMIKSLHRPIKYQQLK